MTLTLYELAGLGDRRYSLFSWRSRLALAHKQLPVDCRGVRVSDKAAIAFSGQQRVPILVDGDVVVPDSWAIAVHLEHAYPGRPTLFGCEAGLALARFVNTWVDRQVVPALAPLVVCDVTARVDGADGAHLRAQMEAAFGQSLEAMREERPARVRTLRTVLDAARATLRRQRFLSGERALYGDYVLFSVFQWARMISDFELLEPDDALYGWRERMLDLFDGLARQAG